MKVLALIAARAGSKGLKSKNVRKLAGVPLLTRAVRLAHQSQRKGERWRVAVSTESPAYARLARAAGADVIARPRDLATDRARLIDAVLHAITDSDCDVLLLLSATTPLTKPSDVRRVLSAWRRHRVGVASITRDTPASLRFSRDGGTLEATSRALPGRRQMEPSIWRLNGALYAASPTWLERHGRFVVAGKSVGVTMPKSRSLDIEDAEDLAIAGALLSAGM